MELAGQKDYTDRNTINYNSSLQICTKCTLVLMSQNTGTVLNFLLYLQNIGIASSCCYLKYILLEKIHEKVVDAFCLCIYSKASVSEEISFEFWILTLSYLGPSTSHGCNFQPNGSIKFKFFVNPTEFWACPSNILMIAKSEYFYFAELSRCQ